MCRIVYRNAGTMVNRAEQKYNMAMDILAWRPRCGYTEEQLRAMPMPKLEALHNEAFWQRHSEMNRI